MKDNKIICIISPVQFLILFLYSILPDQLLLLIKLLINLLMKARPKSAKSQFEINFETRMTFQRNKKFIDLQKMANLQRQYSALRRRPLKSEDNHISQKINTSFMNTTAEMTQRANKSGAKHRSRISFQGQSTSTLQERQQVQQNMSRNQTRSKSFSIQKMTSRQHHHNLKNKPVNDERRFNNFEQFKPTNLIYCNYDKMLGKEDEDYSKKINHLQYNTQKLYEEYYYKRTTNNCKVDYKSEKKLKGERYFFIPKRPQQIAATDLEPEQIDKGLRIASNFKFNNISKGNIDQFYRNSGRELPSQAEKRQMNELTNYWKDDSGKIEKKKLDFQTRKLKDDMNTERMRKIKYSKQAKTNRSQMCDEKFFRYFKH